MPSFLQLPGGLPWWVTLAILVPIALYCLLFLAMPFSVFGLKGRLDSLEARLDEIQEEIRSLAIRLPEPSVAARPEPAGRPSQRPPPIAPAPSPDDDDLPRFQPDPAPARRAVTVRPPRAEPRLDWPR
jgi:hypothetical protein